MGLKLSGVQPGLANKATASEKPQTEVRVAEIIDAMGVLAAEIKPLEKKKKEYEELRKELVALTMAQAEPQAEEVLAGDQFQVAIGAASMKREVAANSVVYKVVGHETFMALAKISLGDIDKYVTEDLKAKIVTSVPAGPRKVTVMPKAA